MFDHIGVLHVLILAALTVALYHARRILPARMPLFCNDGRRGEADKSQRRYMILLDLTEVTLAAIFFLVGGAKLIGEHDMIVLFREIGLGQWFRYVTGTVEVSGALLLVLPFLRGISAIALGGVMIVASLVELLVLHRTPIAALACLGAHAFVAWGRVSHRPALSRCGDREGREVSSGLTRGLAARWAFPRWARVRDPFRAAPRNIASPRHLPVVQRCSGTMTSAYKEQTG